MSYLAFSIIIPFLLLIASALLHLYNLNRVHKGIDGALGKSVTKEAFYRSLFISPGSNFIALAMAAWIMLFVAIGYLYLLVPTSFSYGYLTQMPDWASYPFGFFIFGIIIALLVASAIIALDMLPSESHREFRPTELYSFYAISKSMKRAIASTILFLWISIGLSFWIGIIYPEHNVLLESLSFILLLASTTVLVLPIWGGRA